MRMRQPRFVTKHGMLQRASRAWRLHAEGIKYRLTLNEGDQVRAAGMLGQMVMVMGDLYPGYLIRVSSMHP